jgi:hypothetical protein
MLEERSLDGAECVAACEAFDGRHLRAVYRSGQREAGVDAAPIDQNGAGAALAVVATLFGARQVEVLAQGV